MPGHLIPHKSGAHRLACLSLYRNLIKQCSEFANASADASDGISTGSPPPSSTLNATFTASYLQSIVRHRFRKDSRLVSPHRIAAGLTGGRSLLILLQDATDGNPTALSQLTSVLTDVASQAESVAENRALKQANRAPPLERFLARIEHRRRGMTKSLQTRQPDNPPVLERPLPLERIKSGKRAVPYLVGTGGIPFLRYPGEQPAALSRVLRQRLAWLVKKQHQTKELEYWTWFGEMEDAWDAIIEPDLSNTHQQRQQSRGWSGGWPKDMETGAGRVDGFSWAHEPRAAIRMIGGQISQRDRKYEQMGADMWEVVKKEMAMAEQEQMDARLKQEAADLAAPTVPGAGAGADGTVTTTSSATATGTETEAKTKRKRRGLGLDLEFP